MRTYFSLHASLSYQLLQGAGMATLHISYFFRNPLFLGNKCWQKTFDCISISKGKEKGVRNGMSHRVACISMHREERQLHLDFHLISIYLGNVGKCDQIQLDQDYKRESQTFLVSLLAFKSSTAAAGIFFCCQTDTFPQEHFRGIY